MAEDRVAVGNDRAVVGDHRMAVGKDRAAVGKTILNNLLSQDGCTTEKLAQGIRAFVSDTNKLEAALRAKL